MLSEGGTLIPYHKATPCRYAVLNAQTPRSNPINTSIKNQIVVHVCERIIFFPISNFKKEFLHRKTTFAWSGANNFQLPAAKHMPPVRAALCRFPGLSRRHEIRQVSIEYFHIAFGREEERLLVGKCN